MMCVCVCVRVCVCVCVCVGCKYVYLKRLVVGVYVCLRTSRGKEEGVQMQEDAQCSFLCYNIQWVRVYGSVCVCVGVCGLCCRWMVARWVGDIEF